MSVDLLYTVPVCVTVDLETGEVQRVRVWDESVTGPTGPALDTPADDVERATAIADEEEWPAWEVG